MKCLMVFIVSVVLLAIWHCCLVHSVAYHLSEKKFGPSLYSVPAYDYFDQLQYQVPKTIQKIDVFNNIIYFCGTCLQSYVCTQQTAPLQLAWVDPYSLIFPLEIRICL